MTLPARAAPPTDSAHLPRFILESAVVVQCSGSQAKQTRHRLHAFFQSVQPGLATHETNYTHTASGYACVTFQGLFPKCRRNPPQNHDTPLERSPAFSTGRIRTFTATAVEERPLIGPLAVAVFFVVPLEVEGEKRAAAVIAERIEDAARRAVNVDSEESLSC